MAPPTLFLIDGSNQMYRAYHAIRGLTRSDGKSTNATYGFITMLRKLLSEGGDLPDHFGRDEVVAILRKYYEGLTEKVEIKTHKAATGN